MHTPLRVEPPDAATLPALWSLLSIAFHHPAEAWAVWGGVVGEHNLRAAWSGAELVGGCGVYRMGQIFGGAPVAVGGVAGVGVALHARGRGVARALLHTTVRELRAEGVPLAGLYPASQHVYRSYGFEVAGTSIEYAVPLAAIGAFPRALTAEPTEDWDLLRSLRRPGHGQAVRTPGLWARVLQPHGVPTRAYRFGDEGYAVLSHEGERGFSVRLRDWAALTPAAHHAIWGLLADHRSIAQEAIWTGGASDPLLTLLPEPSWTVRRHKRWMLRATDAPAALTARGWNPAVSCRFVLDLTDPWVPEHEGPWTVEVEGGRASVYRGGTDGLRLAPQGFGPLFSGLHPASTLRRLGLLAGGDAMVDAADRAFAGPEPYLTDHY